jgi:hypothetical protein
MKKRLLSICTIIVSMTIVHLHASQQHNPYTPSLTARITKKTTKAQLLQQITKLQKAMARVDEHYQEEVKDAREKLAHAEQERDETEEKLFTAQQQEAVQKQLLIAATVERDALTLQHSLEKRAFVQSVNAQHELLKFQNEKLITKRAEIAQLKKTIEELRKNQAPARSPSMIAAMYA